MLSTATDISQAIAEAPLSLEDKLRWHFILFPNMRIGEDAVPVLKAAILMAKTGGDLDTKLRLPDGKTPGKKLYASAGRLIEIFKLGVYV